MNPLVIVDFKLCLPEIVLKHECLSPVLPDILSVHRVNPRLDLSLQVHHNNLRVKLRPLRLVKWVIRDLKRYPIHIGELKCKERAVLVHDRVVLHNIPLLVSTLDRLSLYVLNVL